MGNNVKKDEEGNIKEKNNNGKNKKEVRGKVKEMSSNEGKSERKREILNVKVREREDYRDRGGNKYCMQVERKRMGLRRALESFSCFYI